MNKVLIILGLVLLAGSVAMFHTNKETNTQNTQATTTNVSDDSYVVTSFSGVNTIVKLDNKASTTKNKVVRRVTTDASRVITIEGEIGSEMDQKAQELRDMDAASNAPIYILLNSPGGNVLDGSVFISAMESARSPVYTVCTKICASMAAMIHQYGKKRYMLDRSILMFHSAAAGSEGPIEQMKSFTDFLINYTSKLEHHVAARANIEYEQYKYRILQQVWVDAEDATDQNFNDEIISLDVKGISLNSLMVPVTAPSNSRQRTYIENVKWD